MAARLDIEVDESTLKMLVVNWLSEKVGSVVNEEDVTIEVKSKQNYKSEWESASFRARVSKNIS